MIVQIALDLLAWMPMLAPTGADRLWEPAACGGCSPPPLSSSPPAAAASSGSPSTGPEPITEALGRLHALPNPG